MRDGGQGAVDMDLEDGVTLVGGEGLSYHGMTDVGLVRKANEDGYGFYGEGGVQLGTAGGLEGGQPLVAVVSDGVGGHAEGEVASSSVVAAVGAGLGQLSGLHGTMDDDEIKLRLAGMLAGLNAQILAVGTQRGQVSGKRMAATLTAAWFIAGRVWILHVGDSRLYRYRQGQLVQLTQDDTAAGEAVAAGQMNESEARAHPQRHVLRRAIGMRKDQFSARVEVHTVMPSDVYLLCTDGLTDGLTNAQLQSGFVRYTPENPAAFTTLLIESANRNSGKDNVTVGLIQVGAGWRPLGANTRVKERQDLPNRCKGGGAWLLGAGIVLLGVSTLIGFLSLQTRATKRQSESLIEKEQARIAHYQMLREELEAMTEQMNSIVIKSPAAEPAKTPPALTPQP